MFAPHRLMMTRVSRDEAACSASRCDFQGGKIVCVRSLEGQGSREHRLAAAFDPLAQGADILRGERESRPRENGSIFGENSIVIERHEVALEQQPEQLGRRSVG